MLNNNISESIIFESEISHEKLNNFYNEIDLFVLPSYYEGLGCVYLESWAAGTPFIGIKGQGISEIAPDNNRMLAKKKDIADLLDKIEYFSNNNSKFELSTNLNIINTIDNFLKIDLFQQND